MWRKSKGRSTITEGRCRGGHPRQLPSLVQLLGGAQLVGEVDHLLEAEVVGEHAAVAGDANLAPGKAAQPGVEVVRVVGGE